MIRGLFDTRRLRQENEQLRADNEALRRLLRDALDALPEPRKGRQPGDPIDFRHIPDAQIDRLAELCNIKVIPDPPRLSVVTGDREAHSHATKGQESA